MVVLRRLKTEDCNMRFLVKEQRYEKQIGSGQFRYELDGQPTGAVETWRLNAALDGYEVLRVDLDARQAASGHSYLYHLVRQANGRPERLAYRFWGYDLEIEGTLLFAETNITGTRAVNGRTFPEDLNITPNIGFWFPSAIGLGLAANMESGTAVTLNNTIGGEETLTLTQIEMNVSPRMTDVVEIAVAGKLVQTTAWQIQWSNAMRFIMKDAQGWPLRMERDDGLTAVEIRYIWYG